MAGKKTFLLGAAVIALAMTWNIPAQETEEAIPAESTAVHVWQGYSENASCTFVVDSDSGTAIVSATTADSTMTSVEGTCETDESGNLIVTSSEEEAKTWTVSSASDWQKTVSGKSLLSGEETEYTLVEVDPSISGLINDYVWYAGLSEEGDAYTYGISPDCTKLIFGFYTPGDETLYETAFSLEITDSGDGTLSGTATDEDGGMYAFSCEMIDENALHALIQLNGESCETSAVEARLFGEYQQES